MDKTRASRPVQKVRTSNTFTATQKNAPAKAGVKTKAQISAKGVVQSPRSRSGQRSEPGGAPSKTPDSARGRSRSLCPNDVPDATAGARAPAVDKPRGVLQGGVTFSSQVLEASINGTVTPKKLCLLSPSPGGSSESASTSGSDTQGQLSRAAEMPQATPLSRNAAGEKAANRPPRHSRAKAPDAKKKSSRGKDGGEPPSAAALWRKSGAADESLLSTISRDSDSFMQAVDDVSLNDTRASSASETSEEYHDASGIVPSNAMPAKDGVVTSSSTEMRRGVEQTSQSVIVAIRVRPFVIKELENPTVNRLVIGMDNTSTTINPPEPQGGPPQTPHAPWKCRYDHCFWSHSDVSSNGAQFSSQRNVYETLGRPLLTKAFEGYNTSLFAYGQTGSGKTYSMMGVPEDPGIIPRFAEDLFRRIEGVTRQNTPSLNYQFDIKVSCYEIYNEKIYDLLRPNIPGERAPALRVREHASTGPYVENLTIRDVTSQEDVKVYIDIANKNRATAATAMNDRSSRSHAVFNIILHQSKTENLDDLGEAISEKTSNVTLIDLAGSERADSSDTNGERLKEGASINKSLSTLGHVISALSKRESFIPYRNSVLTWLLKESLGGNAQTAMLFTVSPSAVHLETTMSTLRYASTTRNIVNVATVNEDPKGRIISELRDEVRHLREAVHVLRDRLARAGLPYDDVCATPPLAPPSREKEPTLARSDSRSILKRQTSQTECGNTITINQELAQGPAPKVCVSVSVGDSFSKLPGVSPSGADATPTKMTTSTVSRRNLADVEVNTSFVFATPPQGGQNNAVDQEQIEKLKSEMRNQDDIIDDLRSKISAMSEEFKMEKEAKDQNRRQLLHAAEEAEKEKSSLRKKLMLAEAIIEKKSTPRGNRSPQNGAASASLQPQMKAEPFANLLNVIRSHTDALKVATEKKAPPPLLNFDVGKENLSNFPRMLTDTCSLSDPPQHLREDVELSRKILKANRLASRNHLSEIYGVSHMGSSAGDYCKVVKVVTSSPPSAVSSRPLKALPAPTTRLMSLPEFEGKLEQLKNAASSRREEETDVKTSPPRDAGTPSSEHYETADPFDSGTERSSSAVSRYSDSTAISVSSSATDGDTFDVTSCDITCVSSLAS